MTECCDCGNQPPFPPPLLIGKQSRPTGSLSAWYEFHKNCHSVTFIVLVNSHQRWKQTRFCISFHLWFELTSTLNLMEWQVSWNSLRALSEPVSLDCLPISRGGGKGGCLAQSQHLVILNEIYPEYSFVTLSCEFHEIILYGNLLLKIFCISYPGHFSNFPKTIYLSESLFRW